VQLLLAYLPAQIFIKKSESQNITTTLKRRKFGWSLPEVSAMP